MSAFHDGLAMMSGDSDMGMIYPFSKPDNYWVSYRGKEIGEVFKTGPRAWEAQYYDGSTIARTGSKTAAYKALMSAHAKAIRQAGPEVF